MGAIGGMFGLAGGANGTGFGTPGSANIANPVTADQISQSYGSNQQSLQAQQQLLQAIQGQNGLQNQSNVYDQLQGVANGTGPNPAQAMLNQQTGQNVANQAALMAGQRGASSNVGLMARQAAQQGAATQQQAVGQGATMQANQSLNALNSMGSMANTMASNQIGQTNANTSAQQGEQSSLLGAQNAYNAAQVSNNSNVNNANASLANTQMGTQAGAIGGISNAVGVLGGIVPKAHGGMIEKKYADGGAVSAYPGQSEFGSFIHEMSQPQSPGQEGSPQGNNSPEQNKSLQNGMSGASQAGLKGMMESGAAPSTGLMAGGAGDAVMEAAPLAMMAAHGGGVPAAVSPGEKYLSPQAVQAVEQGANPMQVGKTIPGQPKVGGAKDSYKNDTVPTTLQEGGIVVPRSKTQSKNPDKASMDFVHNVLAKRTAKGKR